MPATERGASGAKRPRVAIVGAGLMGRSHAQAAARAGGGIVAVVDLDPARGARLASRYAGSKAVTALDAVLGEVDLVHLCTPGASHAALAREALEAGRHALVEKPLAPAADETLSLLDLAAERRVLLCPV